MEKIVIGKVVNVVGLKGEIKIYNYAEEQERYEKLETVFLGSEKKNSPYKIEKVRYKDHMVILKLQGIDDRNAAESVRNSLVLMSEDDLEELPEGIYYIRDILGMNVCDQSGKLLGVLKDVLTNTPQKVYVVGREKGSDILIPAVEQFILDTDMEKKIITVNVIEGLYED